jgi:hypothetical protein
MASPPDERPFREGPGKEERETAVTGWRSGS